MKSVLLPTDMSEAALDAAVFAARLFGTRSVSYTLVHAYVEPVMTDPVVVGSMPDVGSIAREAMARHEQLFRERTGSRSLMLKSMVVHGSLAFQVDDLTQNGAFSYVVLGTGTLDNSSLFGSGAAAVVRASHAPVIVVPQGATYTGITRILFAEDGGEIRMNALFPLKQLATEQGAEMLVLHVLPKGALDTSANGDPAHHALLADVPHSFIRVHADDVAAAIDDEAVRDGVGMVAVLHRHLGLLDGFFHRSTAKRLADRTHVPLLVLEQ